MADYCNYYKNTFRQSLTLHPRFSQADIHDFAQNLLDTLLAKIASAGTPEKVAENDHLMKCMRFAPSCYDILLLTVVPVRRYACHCYRSTDLDTRIRVHTR